MIANQRFCVDVPPHLCSTSTEANTVIDLPPRHRLDILVIDDDETIRRGMELTLGHLGHLVLSADGLTSARSMLATFDFDLLLCDYNLADGNGAEVLHHLPPHRPRAPVILVSGVSADRLPPASADGPRFDAYLPKPLDIALLQRVVARLLGRVL